MIREVEGDILLTHAQLIAHGIAPQDPFDSGLALALRERWPSMVRDYRHAVRANSINPGEVWPWAGVNEDGSVRRILNLVTQNNLGDGKTARPGKASLENVRHVLQNLAKYVQAEGITSVALPRLATGVGGLDWSEVKPLVQQYLGELTIPVVVYEVYQKGVAADEKL